MGRTCIINLTTAASTHHITASAASGNMIIVRSHSHAYFVPLHAGSNSVA